MPPKLTAHVALARAASLVATSQQWGDLNPYGRRYWTKEARLEISELRKLGFEVVPTPSLKLSKKRSA